jgi:sec-independent protein translocase protein TatA
MTEIALSPASTPILAFFNLNPGEIILFAFLGLLIFGNKLPDVGRSLGQGIVQFKKGLRGLKDEMDEALEDDDRGESRRKIEAKTSAKVSEPSARSETAATGAASVSPSASSLIKPPTDGAPVAQGSVAEPTPAASPAAPTAPAVSTEKPAA